MGTLPAHCGSAPYTKGPEDGDPSPAWIRRRHGERPKRLSGTHIILHSTAHLCGMQQDRIKAIFDEQAAHYDAQWVRTAPIRDALHMLLDSLFAGLPANARILCVGVGTGAELHHLASHNPGWHFTAVDPSESMLDQCRSKARVHGYLDRVTFHAGYLDTLADAPLHHAATSFLVSQFILDRTAREQYFREIAALLVPGGRLACTDLSADTEAPTYDLLLGAWMHLMQGPGRTDVDRENLRRSYRTMVAILPSAMVQDILRNAGFTQPLEFYQAGLIKGWLATRP